MDAGIGIGRGIDALFLVKDVSFPIAELCILGNTLAKEVGPKFLQTQVFDAHADGEVLEIDKSCGMDRTAMGEHAEIVVEREANLEDHRVFEQFNKAGGKPHNVETEEKTGIVVGNLQ